MEAMWTRFLPHVRHDPGAAAGGLGDVVTVAADHGQWFAEDPRFRLFAPELGGGALLDLGIYPVSFASMVLGAPDPVAAMVDPAFTGVDAQMSMLFGYPSGAQAVLNCTLSAGSPTTAAIVGTDARIEIDGALLRPDLVHAVAARRRATPLRVRRRGPWPAAPGRRGRAAAGGRRDREPAHAARRNRLDHDDHGPGTQRS